MSGSSQCAAAPSAHVLVEGLQNLSDTDRMSFSTSTDMQLKVSLTPNVLRDFYRSKEKNFESYLKRIAKKHNTPEGTKNQTLVSGISNTTSDVQSTTPQCPRTKQALSIVETSETMPLFSNLKNSKFDSMRTEDDSKLSASSVERIAANVHESTDNTTKFPSDVVSYSSAASAPHEDRTNPLDTPISNTDSCLSLMHRLPHAKDVPTLTDSLVSDCASKETETHPVLLLDKRERLSLHASVKVVGGENERDEQEKGERSRHFSSPLMPLNASGLHMSSLTEFSNGTTEPHHSSSENCTNEIATWCASSLNGHGTQTEGPVLHQASNSKDGALSQNDSIAFAVASNAADSTAVSCRTVLSYLRAQQDLRNQHKSTLKFLSELECLLHRQESLHLEMTQQKTNLQVDAIEAHPSWLPTVLRRTTESEGGAVVYTENMLLKDAGCQLGLNGATGEKCNGFRCVNADEAVKLETTSDIIMRPLRALHHTLTEVVLPNSNSSSKGPMTHLGCERREYDALWKELEGLELRVTSTFRGIDRFVSKMSSSREFGRKLPACTPPPRDQQASSHVVVPHFITNEATEGIVEAVQPHAQFVHSVVQQQSTLQGKYEKFLVDMQEARDVLAQIVVHRRQSMDCGEAHLAEKAFYQEVEQREQYNNFIAQQGLKFLDQWKSDLQHILQSQLVQRIHSVTVHRSHHGATAQKFMNLCETDMKKLVRLMQGADALRLKAALRHETTMSRLRTSLSSTCDEEKQVWEEMRRCLRRFAALEEGRKNICEEMMQSKEAFERAQGEFFVLQRMAQDRTRCLHGAWEWAKLTQHYMNLTSDGVLSVLNRTSQVLAQHALPRVEQAHTQVSSELSWAAREYETLLNELHHRKQNKLRDLNMAIEAAHIQLELCSDSLNPIAKKYSEQKKSLIEQRDALQQEIDRQLSGRLRKLDVSVRRSDIGV